MQFRRKILYSFPLHSRVSRKRSSNVKFSNWSERIDFPVNREENPLCIPYPDLSKITIHSDP